MRRPCGGSGRGAVFIAVVLTMSLLVEGCEIRPKPFVHMVEYRSDGACVERLADCSWEKLEREAEFAALVNCLLDGANVLEVKEEGQVADQTVRRVVAPVPPRYGYEPQEDAGPDRQCSAGARLCSVASRHDRPHTWASCGTRSLADGELRGGEDHARADPLLRTDVVTGTLASARDDYSAPMGLDGPDHWYRLTIPERTRVEAAVAANRALWSGIVGLVQSPWQPALYLLSAEGDQLRYGYVHRAGVTAVLPTTLEPGTYYLVVDSSVREWSRGDGLYRLYVGWNRSLLGSMEMGRLGGD